jgi:hypothetical protein
MNPNHEISSEKSSENGMYYEKLADKYRIAKFLTLALLVLCILLTVIFSADAFRAVNFRYLTKYFRINPTTLDKTYHDIAYAVGGGSAFVLYHDDLAVLGEGKMALYDLSGDLVYRSDIEKGTASVDSGGRYLAAYTAGGKRVTFFHSFDTVLERSFSDPVSKVCVSDTGIAAVCLQEREKTSVVLLDEYLKTEKTLTLSEGVMMDMAISDDGKTLSVLTLVGEGASFYTRLDLWNLKSGEIVMTEAFAGKKPIATGAFAGGGFFAIFSRLAVFLEADGTVKARVPLAFDSVRYDVFGDRLLLLTPSGMLSLLESDGNACFSKNISQTVLSMRFEKDTAYLLTERSVLQYDEKGNLLTQTEIPSGVLDFFVLDDGSLLLCYASETKRIMPSDS